MAGQGNNGNGLLERRLQELAEERRRLAMIIDGKMSAMTAALSGVLSIEGELGMAMKLVPVFFEG